MPKSNYHTIEIELFKQFYYTVLSPINHVNCQIITIVKKVSSRSLGSSNKKDKLCFWLEANNFKVSFSSSSVCCFFYNDSYNSRKYKYPEIIFHPVKSLQTISPKYAKSTLTKNSTQMQM